MVCCANMCPRQIAARNKQTNRRNIWGEKKGWSPTTSSVSTQFNKPHHFQMFPSKSPSNLQENVEKLRSSGLMRIFQHKLWRQLKYFRDKVLRAAWSLSLDQFSQINGNTSFLRTFSTKAQLPESQDTEDGLMDMNLYPWSTLDYIRTVSAKAMSWSVFFIQIDLIDESKQESSWSHRGKGFVLRFNKWATRANSQCGLFYRSLKRVVWVFFSLWLLSNSANCHRYLLLCMCNHL